MICYQNCAFDCQSMTINSVVNSFAQSLEDGKGIFCQADYEHVGTLSSKPEKGSTD